MSQNAVSCTSAEVCSEAEVPPSSQPAALPVLEKQASARLLDLLSHGPPKEEEAAPPERTYVTWKTPGGLSPNKRFGTPSSGLVRASSVLAQEDVLPKLVPQNSMPAISAFALAQQPHTSDSSDVGLEGFAPGAQGSRPRMSVDRFPGPANGMAKHLSPAPGPGDRAALPYLDRHVPPRGNTSGKSPFPSAFSQDTGAMERASSANLHRLDGQPSSSLFMQERPPTTMMGVDRQHSTKLGGLERQPSNSPLALERQPSESILAAVGQQLPSPDSPPAQDTHIGSAFKRSPASQLGSVGVMPFKGHGPMPPARMGPLQPYSTRGPEGIAGFGRSSALPRKPPEGFAPGAAVPKMAPLQKTSSALPPYFGPVPSSSITDIAETSSLKRTASLNNIGAQMPLAGSMGRQPSSPIPLAALKDIPGMVNATAHNGLATDANPRPPSTPPGIAPQSIGAGKVSGADAGSQEGSPGPEAALAKGLPKGSSEKDATPGGAWSVGTPPPNLPPAGWEQASPPAGAGPAATATQSFASPFASLSQAPISVAGSDGAVERHQSETPPPTSPSSNLPTSQATQVSALGGGAEFDHDAAHMSSPFNKLYKPADDAPVAASNFHVSQMTSSTGLPGIGDQSGPLNVEGLAAMLSSTLGQRPAGEAGVAQDLLGGQKGLPPDFLRQLNDDNKREGLEALFRSGGPPSPGSLNGFAGDLGPGMATGKRMVHSGSRESLPGALLQGAGGSRGDEHLQALLSSRLSGDVPPPPPPLVPSFHMGLGGGGAQGRGAPLAPEIFQPIPAGLANRGTMPAQLGGQRVRPNARQGVGVPTMPNVAAAQRYREMYTLGLGLVEYKPQEVQLLLQNSFQNRQITRSDVEVISGGYNQAVKEVAQKEALLIQQHRQQQQQQQITSVAQLQEVLSNIKQLTTGRLELEAGIATIQQRINAVPLHMRQMPNVLAVLTQKQKLAENLALCNAKLQQYINMYQAFVQRQSAADEQMLKVQQMQYAHLLQQQNRQQQQQQQAVAQAQRDMFIDQQLLQQVLAVQAQANAQAHAQAQQHQQVAAAQILLAQQQQQQQNLFNDQYQLLQQQYLAAGAANAAGSRLTDEAILANAIRNPSPAPAPSMGPLPQGMAYQPAPPRGAPSKFPVSDMPPRMVQDPLLAQNYGMQAQHNGRRSPMWPQRDVIQPSVPQQPTHPTMPSTWSIGSSDTPKPGPLGPSAPLNQGPGLRLVPDGSLAPPTSIAMPSFGPLFTYHSQDGGESASGVASAVSRGPSPAPQNNAGLHMLWGPSGSQQGGNVWGAPAIGGTSKAQGTVPAPLDFGPTFQSLDSSGVTGGGWGEVKAGASQGSAGVAESGPPRDEFDATKFGFFGSLPKSTGGPLDELEPADSKEGQEEYDAPVWALDGC